MAPTLYTLQLEPFDDVVSIRDRLTFIQASHVLLMCPPGTPVFRRKLDLLLVQRQAMRLRMRIALITDDLTLIEHADDLNISVFPDEQTARVGRWKRSRATVFAPPRDPDERAEIVDHVLRQRMPLSPAALRRRRLGRLILFAALLIAFLLSLFLAVPSATVTVTPASRQVYENVAIVADPALTDIDIENRRMPASIVPLQVTSDVTVQTSGKETAGMSRAQGLVTFTNDGDQPILIPLGTITATSGAYPVRFETLVETTLPAGNAASVQVPIQALAEHAGPAGNVSPGAINRVEADFADLVTATNPNATYGGAVQEVSLVTADDQARLLVLGRQQLLQNARDELLHYLSGDQFLVPGSITITAERPEWTIYSAVVGDVAESVSLSLRANVQGVVVDEGQAQQVAFSALAPYLQPGLEIEPNDIVYTRGDILDLDPGGRVTFLMVVKGNIAVSIDKSAVRDRMVGVSVDEARDRLERELLLDPERPPHIATWPPWYSRMPVLPVRISVKVNAP
jgi:hypothetical protein